MVLALEALAAEAPELVRLVSMGSSVEGRPIFGLRISAAETAQAGWRVLGAHHGDEPPSAELALALARALVERYGADEAVTALLDRDEVWIVPQVNPDGVAALTRANADGVDLNRNYDYQWSERETSPGEAAFSEPETRAIRALHAWTPLAAGLSLHAGAANIGWVWNYTTAASPDEPLVEAMGEDYAAAVEDPAFWATNGADWYLTWGDTTDWSYGRHGTLDFTLEISEDKQPDEAALAALIEAHREAMLGFFAWPDRLTGRVVDAETGLGLPASVTVEGGAPLWAGPDGRFARLVDGAATTVQVAVPGYETLSLDAVEPGDLGEIPLAPVARGTARPWPSVLERDAPGWFRLTEAADAVTLRRGGEAPVAARRQGLLWWVDLDALAPGPWDLDVDGVVSPRALFVGEVEPVSGLDAAALEGDELWISGWNLGRGSRVFALWGAARAPVELPVLDEDETGITADASALAEAPALVDLLVLSGGAQLAWPDLREIEDAPEAAAAPVGCATPSGPRGWSGALLALALTRRGRAAGASWSRRGSRR